MAKAPETLGEKITYVEGRWALCADQLDLYKQMVTTLAQAKRKLQQHGDPNCTVCLNITQEQFLLITSAISLLTVETMLRKEGGRSMHQRN